MIPGIKVIGLVTNSYNANVALQLTRSEEAIRELGLQSRVAEARTPDEFEKAFESLKAGNAEGVMLLADPTVIENGKKIAELALAAGLPTAFQRRENVEAGGLFSYGGSITDQFKFAAQYVDRILKGAKPAELPVEQPTQFNLVINTRTAKRLGLTIPSGVLAIANELIE
jgi:putative ABC transport system substrate-binding protein